MNPVLTFILVAVGVFCFAGALFFFWLRSKLRRGVRWLKVQGLEVAVDELRKKLAEPDKQPDPELEALLNRVIEAHDRAKTAFDNGDLNTVDEVADPVLLELTERIKKQAEEEERAKQAIENQPEAPAAEPVVLALPPASEPAGGDKPAVPATPSVNSPDAENKPGQ